MGSIFAVKRTEWAELPQPARLVGTTDLAGMLGIDTKAAKKLMRSGLAGPAYELAPRGFYVPESPVLDELAGRDWLRAPYVSAFVARVGPPEIAPPGDGRTFLGWHACLPEEQHDSYSRWWPAADPEALVGGLFIATIATFVVVVRRIEGFETGPGRLRAFDLAEAGDEGAPFRGARIRTPPGGNTVLLPGSS